MIKGRKRTIVLFLLPAFLFIALFVYVPIILNFYYSMFRWSAFSADKVFIGMDNITRLFQDPTIGICIKNNLIYAVFSVALQVGLALVLAAVLEDKLFRGSQPFFRTVYFLPSLISVTVVGLLWQMIYSPIFGLLNPILRMMGLPASDWLGSQTWAIFAVTMVSQWQYTGYTMVLFIVALQKIPEDLYEAATIDGAGRIQKFFYITIPQAKEMIIVNMVITVIGSFKVFDEVYVMTSGGPGVASQVLGSYLYRAAFSSDEMGYAAAIATLLFVITFVLSLIQIKASNIETE